MAKGGRYLAKNRGAKAAPAGKKKGRGWKIALIVLIILALLLGGAYFAVSRYYKRMLGLVNRAEIEDRGASVEDILDAARYNPDLETYVPTEEGSVSDETQPSAETVADES